MHELPPAVHLFLLRRFVELSEERLDELSYAERIRANTISDGPTRSLFVHGRMLLRRALSKVYGVVDANIEIDGFGRPFLKDSSVRFNLSHTRDAVVVLLARDLDVGVDVERLDRPVDVFPVAERTFSREEIDWVHERDTMRRFFEVWTLKEAYMKARGLGFRLPPRSFGFSLRQDPPRLKRVPRGHCGHWVFRRETLLGLQLGLALRGQALTRGSRVMRYDGAMLW